MKTTVYICYGESFLEVAANKDNQFISRRYLLSKTSFINSLKMFCNEQEIKPDEIKILFRSFFHFLKVRIGTPTAFITTEGFQDWITINSDFQERDKHPYFLNSELIFGVNERIDANGSIIEKINEEEIHFLIEKLKMNNVSHIALGFLHSDTNNENELKVYDLLKEHFKVYKSCDYSKYTKQYIPSERQRWLSAILTSYSQPAYEELIENIESECKNNINEKINLQVINSNLEWWPAQEVLLSDTVSAASKLFSHLIEKQEDTKFKSIIDLDFDRFLYINNSIDEQCLDFESYGPLSISKGKCLDLPVQPRTMLQTGFWGLPSFSNEIITASPGPMCFSHNRSSCILDVLFVQGYLNQMIPKHIPTERRIQDFIISMSKDAMLEDSLSVSDVINHTEDLFIKRIRLFCDNLHENYIYLAGPFAKLIARKLEDQKLKKVIKVLDESSLLLRLCKEKSS